MTRPNLDELQGLDATSQAYERLKEGLDYVAGDRVTGVAADAVAFDAFVGNEAGSSYDLLTVVTFSTGGAADLDVTDEATVDTAGTVLPIQSKGVDNGNTSVIERGGTYSATGETIGSVIPGSRRGQTPSNTFGSVSVPDARLLEPGEGINYLLTNRGADTARYSMGVGVIQLDPEDYDL